MNEWPDDGIESLDDVEIQEERLCLDLDASDCLCLDWPALGHGEGAAIVVVPGAEAQPDLDHPARLRR